MTARTGQRVYLDWNASAPLRPEARAAMLAAMDLAGNPSSVHAEGRAARAAIEKARAQVAALCLCDPGEVIFTSGATEAAATVLAQGWDRVMATPFEHDAVENALPPHATRIPARLIEGETWDGDIPPAEGARALLIHQAGNGETGTFRPYQVACVEARKAGWRTFVDATQVVGGRRWFNFSDGTATAEADFACLSAHKIGGPRGVGALLVREGIELKPLIHGGGQELRRRSGTEDVVAIAGFGAAAEAATGQDWDAVATLRDALEARLADAAGDITFIETDEFRLPNTSCFAVPGWKGESQVMQMDLAGYAVSAGSACASGKVGPSRVLKAMGFDDITAASAIRVSLGPTTTEAEATGFADAWIECYRRWKQKAA